MLPASTCSPPKRFTPRRLLWDSRPLRVLPPAFLCAISCSLRDRRDLHQRVLLAMIAGPLVVFAATELHDHLLLALAVAFHRGADHCSGEQRRADPEVAAIGDQQHFVERDGRARGCVELLDLQQAVFFDPVLLATGSDHGVHRGELQSERPRILMAAPVAVKPGFTVFSRVQTATWVRSPRRRLLPFTPVFEGGAANR